MTPVAEGTATATVTATDAAGSNTTAAQAFTVTVSASPNRPPEPVGTLAPLTIAVGQAPVTVDVSRAFRDPDGDRLTYAASSSAPAVAAVAVFGSLVTVTPVAEGTATATVTATDAAGSNATAVQSFMVTVTASCTNDLGVVSGTVTRTDSWTGDCISVHDPDKYARYYSFMPLQRSAVRIDLRSSIDTLLALRSGGPGTGSALIDENDDISSGNLNSRIETTLAAGTYYTIEATTYESFTTASFTLTLSATRPFTDHPIVSGETPIKAIHFEELRTRIAEVRARLGLAHHRWTDPVLSAGVTRVRVVHLLELRRALDEAYATAGRPAPSWTDASARAGSTPIRGAPDGVASCGGGTRVRPHRRCWALVRSCWTLVDGPAVEEEGGRRRLHRPTTSTQRHSGPRLVDLPLLVAPRLEQPRRLVVALDRPPR